MGGKLKEENGTMFVVIKNRKIPCKSTEKGLKALNVSVT